MTFKKYILEWRDQWNKWHEALTSDGLIRGYFFLSRATKEAGRRSCSYGYVRCWRVVRVTDKRIMLYTFRPKLK